MVVRRMVLNQSTHDSLILMAISKSLVLTGCMLTGSLSLVPYLAREPWTLTGHGSSAQCDSRHGQKIDCAGQRRFLLLEIPGRKQAPLLMWAVSKSDGKTFKLFGDTFGTCWNHDGRMQVFGGKNRCFAVKQLQWQLQACLIWTYFSDMRSCIQLSIHNIWFGTAILGGAAICSKLLASHYRSHKPLR